MDRLKRLVAAILAYPKWLWVFAILCIGVPIVFGPSPISLFIAFLNLIGCIGTAGNAALSVRRKIALCTFMSASVWLTMFLLTTILFAVINSPR